MIPDQNGIYITKKQASVGAALCIVLGLLIFIAGYFWGKQSVIDGFSQKTSQDSFNDRVDYLLTMQSYAMKNGGESVFPEDDSEKDDEDSESSLPDAREEGGDVEQAGVKTEEKRASPVVAAQRVVDLKSTQAATLEHRKYKAALAGFAKKSFAQQMVQRLKKHGIEVEVKDRSSKSASGKARRSWYQVVTKSYDSADEVQTLIDQILKYEKIKRDDIKIM